MRAAGGDNHHDLGLFSVGPEAPARAARLDRAVPPRLGGAVDRGPRQRQPDPGECRRPRWRLRPRRLEVALRLATPTATSSRSCGASRARRGASTRSTARSCRSTSMPRSVAGAPRPDSRRVAGRRSPFARHPQAAPVVRPGRFRRSALPPSDKEVASMAELTTEVHETACATARSPTSIERASGTCRSTTQIMCGTRSRASTRPISRARPPSTRRRDGSSPRRSATTSRSTTRPTWPRPPSPSRDRRSPRTSELTLPR